MNLNAITLWFRFCVNREISGSPHTPLWEQNVQKWNLRENGYEHCDTLTPLRLIGAGWYLRSYGCNKPRKSTFGVDTCTKKEVITWIFLKIMNFSNFQLVENALLEHQNRLRTTAGDDFGV